MDTTRIVASMQMFLLPLKQCVHEVYNLGILIFVGISSSLPDSFGVTNA
jgi:hypothetical protein